MNHLTQFFNSLFLAELFKGLGVTGRYLFKKSHLPLIKDLPFSFSLHGGVFWSDFNSNPVNLNDDFLISAPRAYSEIGFGIGRLPLFLKLNFTWQLSAYNTNKFSLSCDFGI